MTNAEVLTAREVTADKALTGHGMKLFYDIERGDFWIHAGSRAPREAAVKAKDRRFPAVGDVEQFVRTELQGEVPAGEYLAEAARSTVPFPGTRTVEFRMPPTMPIGLGTGPGPHSP